MKFDEKNIPQFDVVFGRNLLQESECFVADPALIVTMDDLWPIIRESCPPNSVPYFVESMEREFLEKELAKCEGIVSIVGVGGGQAIDCAKYFAWRTRLPLYQYPTSLSVDAVFGHRAGVRENSIVRYVGWAVPETVYIDYDIIENAPRHINTAGIGDVLCFLTGVWDWEYAHDKGKCEEKWPYDESLAKISVGKAEAVLANPADVREMTPNGIRLMVDALRWGGASYHGAGWCPRHVEGVEHYIFYALEALTGKKFLHGQAVCLGIVAGSMMHGKRVSELLDAIHDIGVDIRPQSMDVSWEDVFAALRGLKKFVEKEKLAYGIANDFDVTDEFLNSFKELVYGKDWR